MRIVRPQDLHNHIKGTFRVYQNETEPRMNDWISLKRKPPPVAS